MPRASRPLGPLALRQATRSCPGRPERGEAPRAGPRALPTVAVVPYAVLLEARAQRAPASPRPERQAPRSDSWFGHVSYELQVYATSPLRPTPREILARAGETGLVVELRDAPGARADGDAAAWTKLLLSARDARAGGFLVEDSADLDRMKAQFRADDEAGEQVPEEVFEAQRLYVLELDDETPVGEEHQGAFVVAAWALAGLTEGIVFDPQEEFFADADSFWSILMDEDMDEAPHEGGCCGGHEEEEAEGDGAVILPILPDRGGPPRAL